MPQTLEFGRVAFSVVDVETTGFSPWLHDRVVEVAIVRMDPTVGVLDEYTTLVNPERDVGRTDIHGIRASDVHDAPRWHEVAGDIGSRLQNAVIAGHNLRFDLGFVAAEFSRAGVSVPSALPGVCTLALASRFFPSLTSHKLRHCCAHAGIEHDDEHSALGDARATTHLLASLLSVARECGIDTLERLGCQNTTPPDLWCSVTPSGRTHQRSPGIRGAERSYLARLVEKLPPTLFSNPDEGAYIDLLDRVLEDRRINAGEAETLLRTAFEWGLTRATVFEVHHRYLSSLVRAAIADGVVTGKEYADLEIVCDLLGLHRAALDVPMRQAHAEAGLAPTEALEASLESPSSAATMVAKPHANVASEDLKGQSVCFTGTFMGRLAGQTVTREEVERFAVEAGLIVRQSVTKDLHVLVAADTDTQSGKAKRARRLCIPIITEGDFWRAIGAPVRMSLLG